MRPGRFAIFAAACLAVAFLLDAPVQALVDAHRTPASLALGRAGSLGLSWGFLMIACLAGIGTACRDARWRRILAAAMISCSAAGLLGDASRCMIGRTRPDATAPQGWYGPVRPHWFDDQFHSFPSGHTSAAAGLAAMLWLASRRARLAAAMLVVAVATARLLADAHHLSDVVAGAALGSAVALALWRGALGRWVCAEGAIANPPSD